jgi:MFS family permease
LKVILRLTSPPLAIECARHHNAPAITMRQTLSPVIEQADDTHSLRRFAPALALLAAAMLINYVDRGNLSVAGPLIKNELGLNASQLGILFAAFFVSYTAMQFVVGWLVDRFDVNRILAGGFVIWSLATATTGLLRGFVLLFAIRLILGIGEAVALPASSKILARHLPEHHRGFASGAVMAALRAGNAVGTFGAGYLMAKHGWRPVFIGIGVLSLLWLPAWSKWKPEALSRSEQTSVCNIGFIEILQQRSFWGTSLGHFSCNYLLYFMVTWLPSYLVLERHLSMTSMAKVAGLYYLVDATSAIATGFVQDFWIRQGRSPTLVRKSGMIAGFCVAAITLPGCALAGAHTFTYWLMLAGAGCGMTSPGILTFCQRLAGPRAVGTWYGAQNGFANFAGILCPALTGFVVDRTGNFVLPFAITSMLCVVGGVAWTFIVGRIEPIQWTPEKRVAIAPVSLPAN